MSEILDPIQMEDNVLSTEPAAAPEVAESTAEDESAENTVEKKIYANRAEILERISEIAGIASESVKGEINYLKLLYYKMRQQETDAEMQAFIDGNGDPATYESKPDELEPRLKDLLNIQKEARAAMVKARDEEYANNLALKREVLDKMEKILGVVLTAPNFKYFDL